MAEKIQMKLGHSPDADDAFMFYAIAKDIVKSDKIEFIQVVEDIQSLNKRALNKELEVTAISAHGYLKVQDDYRIMSCGASMGEGYGPIVVSKEPIESLEGKRIGVPGMLTSAYLQLCIYADGFIPVEMAFDEIMPAVQNGEIETGWAQETSLPLPLGLNVVKRDIGEELQKECHRVHKESIEYSLSHKDEGLDYAMEWGRGMKKDVGEKFVLMYVNDYTVELGEEGKAALEYMFKKAFEKGLITEQPRLDILEG